MTTIAPVGNMANMLLLPLLVTSLFSAESVAAVESPPSSSFVDESPADADVLHFKSRELLQDGDEGSERDG